MQYIIDTNAGPILTRTMSDDGEVKRYVERCIPLLAKRGYSHTWSERGAWTVIDVYNSKGRHVHAAAFTRK
jgi:hypothetical protein